MIIVLISSFLLYFFLYKLCIKLGFPYFRCILFTAFLSYLTTSLTYFFYIFDPDLEYIIILLFSNITNILCCLAIKFFRFTNYGSIFDIFGIVMFLNLFSLLHFYYLFDKASIRIDDYPIIHI